MTSRIGADLRLAAAIFGRSTLLLISAMGLTAVWLAPFLYLAFGSLVVKDSEFRLDSVLEPALVLGLVPGSHIRRHPGDKGKPTVFPATRLVRRSAQVDPALGIRSPRYRRIALRTPSLEARISSSRLFLASNIAP